VDRTAGRTGYCGAGDRLEIYRAAAHMGEEPPLSGAGGSGAVFFSRCTLRCGYCQNFPWSRRGAGTACTVEDLARQLAALHAQGCHNWNLVSPTPWLPLIAEALDHAKKHGAWLPLVYNTSGYELPETMHSFRDCADVYLPDLRYARNETARIASDAADYVDVARRAVQWMWEQAGPLRVDSRGNAVRGLICRILVLPGHADEAVTSLEWLAGATGSGAAVSVMSQYRPVYEAAEGRLGPSWQRTVARDEYEKVCLAVERLGFEHGWIQEFGETTTEHLLGCTMKQGLTPECGRQEEKHERT
jgi:putative pyruvate formate lyase activating enzyme